MSPSHLLLFAATELLLSMTPGPAVLLVVSQGMRRGLASSRRGAAGILTGNAIYFALSAAGLGALLIASKRVFDVLQIAGAAYLILLGLKMAAIPSRRVDEREVVESTSRQVDESSSRQGVLEDSTTRRLDDLSPGDSKTRRLDNSFFQGLLTQLANPKALVFFTALLPQFVDATKPMAIQFLVLGVISILVELPVLLAYGFAADRGRAVYGKHAPLIERLSGACLVAAGAKLAASRM